MFLSISIRNDIGSMRVDSDTIVPWASDIIGTCGGGSSNDGCIVSEEVVWSDSREEPDSKKGWSASSSLFEVRKMEEALPYFLLTSVSHSSDFPEARAVFSKSLVHAAMVGPGIPLRWV